MSQQFHIIRKDLYLILAVVVTFGILFGILAYMDAQNQIVTTWAEQFYRFILRQ